MKLNRSTILPFLFMAIGGYAQLSEDLTYSENYYLFPIKPGMSNTLAGTMGELRSTHFHSGIDIRTEGRTGLAVHAAANGFISRASISPTGYGNALYVQHPNGQTTVYAHLEKFTGPLADYVRKEQYRRKTFKLNLYFRKDQFKVSRGDTIAWSGNSGSSGGPHLHFDLRDEYQRPLNPLLYGFDEVKDNTPPVAITLAVKSMDIKARVAGQFGRKEYTLRRIGNDYVIDEPVEAHGNVGFELLAHDKLDYTRFRCGINTIKFSVDSEQVFEQHIKSFAFSEQRTILRHMDYEELATTGKRYHKLYVDEGNELKFYRTNNKKGKVTFAKGDNKLALIELIDSYGNKSKVTFTIVGKENHHLVKGNPIIKSKVHVLDNTLVIKADARDSSDFSIYIPEQIKLSPSFKLNREEEYYLWDLRNGLPRSVEKGDFYKSLDFSDLVPSGVSYSHFNAKMDISFQKYSLFDTLYLETGYTDDSVSNLEIFEIGTATVPLRKNISVTLKPSRRYTNPEKTAVFGVSSKNQLLGYVGGTWKSGKMEFSTRNFGRFTLAEDSIPPSIKPVVINSKDIKFKIEDKLAGLKDFQCYVNDEWVLMHYDYKRKLIWSEKLNADKPFKGSVKLIVRDNVNNKTVYESKIN